MTAGPTDIKARIQDGVLQLTWRPDHIVDLPLKYLRCHCGCAMCVDERTGIRKLDPQTIPEDISIVDMALVGNYAVKIVWTDGHDTGIYSWDYLVRICPCAACGGPKSFDRRPSPLRSDEA